MKMIPGFPMYKATRDGRILSYTRQSRGKELVPSLSMRGYRTVNLYREGIMYHRRVHQLILTTFVGPRPEGLECRHLDGNPGNNCIENLRWGTSRENTMDTIRHGNRVNNKGVNNYHAKLSEDQVKSIYFSYHNGTYSVKELVSIFGVSRSCITDIVNKRRWRCLWGLPEVR